MGYSTIWLFYQNEEGWLSRSTFNSSTGEWTHVAKFVKAKKGSPIAAMAYNSEFYAEDQVGFIAPQQRKLLKSARDFISVVMNVRYNWYT